MFKPFNKILLYLTIILSLIIFNSNIHADSFSYITNKTSGTVSVIDNTTDTVVKTITVGTNPYGISVNATGTRVYITNTASNNVSVINTSTKSVIATIPVGTSPYGIVVNPSGTLVYVANSGTDNVSIISTAINSAIAAIPVGDAPYGITINSQGTKVYVTNSLSNSVSVIDTINLNVTNTIPVSLTPYGIAINPSGTRVYTATTSSDNLSVIDTESNSLIANTYMGAGAYPIGVAVNSAGNRIYVTNTGTGNVKIIDSATNNVIGDIPVGISPSGISLNSLNTKLYVANYYSNNVTVIEIPSYSTTSIAVGNGPVAFGNFYIPESIPIISISPASKNFGAVNIQSSSSPNIFTIMNNGGNNLFIEKVGLSGPNASEFVIQNDNCSDSTIIPAASATLDVVFSPKSIGTKNATLYVVSNDPNSPTKTVNLSGSGDPIPVISVSTQSINFGKVNINNSSTFPKIKIQNNGGADLIIDKLIITGPNAGEFSIQADNCSNSTLASALSNTFDVKFSPTQAGTKNATLSIPTNDPITPTAAILLTGEGNPIPEILVSLQSISFGTINIGSTSSPNKVTITNIGEVNLNLETITIAGPNAGEFSIQNDNCSGKTILKNTNASFEIIFTPKQGGAKNAYINIPSNDPYTPSKTINLSGSGNPIPAISLEAQSIDFGNIIIGESSSPTTLIVTNTGTSDLKINTIILAGQNANEFFIKNDNCSNKTITPSSTAALNIVFTPKTEGLKKAILIIPSNDPNTPNAIISINGQGGIIIPKPIISLSTQTLSFGDLNVGDSTIPKIVTITNIGNASLAIGNISITGSNIEDFIIISDTCSNNIIASLLNGSIEIIFKPKQPGTRNAILNIPSNDPNFSNITVSLNGTGNPIPVISLSDETIYFDTTIIQNSSSPKTVTVTNIGNASLKLGTIEIFGFNKSEFSIQNDNCSDAIIEPSLEKTFELIFTPNSQGTKIASLIIPSNDLKNPDIIISLNGQGSNPPSKPIISISKQSVVFENVMINTISSPETIIVLNSGDNDLIIGKIELAGPNADEFRIQNDNCSDRTISWSGSASFDILFSPLSKGIKSAILYVASNDPKNPVITILLTGITYNKNTDTTGTGGSTGTTTSSKKGCFISGTFNISSNNKNLLNNFRDKYFIPNHITGNIINIYYKYSPQIINFLKKDK
ncbi:MAG: choice-of-anchor D domain-containing protein [Candidatus Firestonebacteria bacterium]|nr:choice-of-anchor D domain-containing protein [Candidatus Firestonebacteria bacterium]